MPKPLIRADGWDLVGITDKTKAADPLSSRLKRGAAFLRVVVAIKNPERVFAPASIPSADLLM
jgi:hypothetical protein